MRVLHLNPSHPSGQAADTDEDSIERYRRYPGHRYAGATRPGARCSGYPAGGGSFHWTG